MSKHVDDLVGMGSVELGVSEWVTIDQDRIDLFADATGDHQWIHVDTERAASGPFGATIAHGYLTLSMLAVFLGPFMDFEGVTTQLNYGLDQVRFPHPVRAGSRIRGRVSIDSAEDRGHGVLLAIKCVIEIEHADKPACVAHPLALLIRNRASA